MEHGFNIISPRLGLEVSSSFIDTLELTALNNADGQVFQVSEEDEKEVLTLRISKETAKKLATTINKYLEVLGEI